MPAYYDKIEMATKSTRGRSWYQQAIYLNFDSAIAQVDMRACLLLME